MRHRRTPSTITPLSEGNSCGNAGVIFGIAFLRIVFLNVRIQNYGTKFDCNTTGRNQMEEMATQNKHPLVGVYRSCDAEGPLRGSVVFETTGWIVLAKLDDSVFFDGYVAIRRHYVTEIHNLTNTGFESRALRALNRTPQPLTGLAARTTVGLITEMSTRFRLVRVDEEMDYPDSCQIGELVSVDRSHMELATVDRMARFDKSSLTIPLKAITMLAWGSKYESAIEAVLASRDERQT
jgi:hypothetical protein